ncbi:MAG TPA: PP2C family serine/threonine-protein phosphatase [Phycisphaerae bacterium]|nr:PP2C family serine/threonine-protein phosphatase [Phycisphaerae bacterium]
MSSDVDKQVRLVLEQDMAGPELVAVGGGVAAVWSGKCPGASSSNEDGALVGPIEEQSAVLAVADGMGGAQAGQKAASVALRALLRTVTGAAPNGSTLRTPILDGVEKANEAVVGLGLGAATTLAVVEVQNDTIRPYHVGDSTILLAGQRGKIKLQTVRHSPVGFAVESGQLDESEAMKRTDRHIVSNVVGDRQMRIEVGPTLRLAARDTLLLATDGLCDNLYVHEIVAIVRSGPIEKAAGRLIETARARMTQPGDGQPSKPDDLTFILFRRRP